MKLKFNIFTKCCLLLVTMLASANFTLAQRNITGTVTDADDGEPLIGANILVVGTSTGTVTDFDGTYSIKVPDGATALSFTYTGYAEQILDIGSSNIMDVQMSSGQVLDEVVVVGYGTQTRKEVTSAVASVSEEDFNGGAIQNPAALLAGKVSGLTIARPGGDPNGDFSIRLRGLSTVGANSEPLIVIDGVAGADLGSVDPNDIASMDVLKDGSAAAIYGTRGSSGVILITTKKGKKGTAQIDYNVYASFDQVAKTVDVATRDEFLAAGGADRGTTTDWFDELTRTGVGQVHNLSMSGGTNSFTYRASANYRDIDGVAINTGFDQLNGRLNLTQKALNDRLTLNANLSATNRRGQLGFDGTNQDAFLPSDAFSPFRYATIYNPTAPILDASQEQYGGYYQEVLFDYFNPVALAEQNDNNKIEKKIFTSLKADFELVDGLIISGLYSQQRENDTQDLYFSKFSFGTGTDNNGLAGLRTDERFNELAEFTANYSLELDGGTDISILAGYSYQDFVDQGFGAVGGDFLSDAFRGNNLSAAQQFPNGLGNAFSYKNSHRLIAFFGRVNANIDDTYFLSASVRREGSSRFGVNNQWGVFPAVSAGVDITNLTDIAGVDNLKLRVGYGVTGAIPSDSYLSIQRFGDLGSSFFFNGNFVPAYGPVSNANPDLKWETKGELNVGIDFSFMDYKLNGSLEYYNRNTQDGILLVDVPVPPNLFSQTWLNVGEISNNGVELALNYAAISNDGFTWETGLTASTFNTELVKFTDGQSVSFRANLGSPGQNSTNLVRVEEGTELGQIVAPVFAGLDENGNWTAEDFDGDGNIIADQDDFQVVGNGLPDLELGFTNTFTFGNFDFNIFLRGAFGHSLVNTFRAFYEGRAITSSYNLIQTELYNPDLAENPRYHDIHVEKADFLKLDNATLGYTLDLPDGGAFRRARVYVSTQNPIVITSYTGADPEVRFADSVSGDPTDENADILAPGIDRRNTYFRTRNFTVGVNLGF